MHCCRTDEGSLTDHSIKWKEGFIQTEEEEGEKGEEEEKGRKVKVMISVTY